MLLLLVQFLLLLYLLLVLISQQKWLHTHNWDQLGHQETSNSDFTISICPLLSQTAAEHFIFQLQSSSSSTKPAAAQDVVPSFSHSFLLPHSLLSSTFFFSFFFDAAVCAAACFSTPAMVVANRGVDVFITARRTRIGKWLMLGCNGEDEFLAVSRGKADRFWPIEVRFGPMARWVSCVRVRATRPDAWKVTIRTPDGGSRGGVGEIGCAWLVCTLG